MSTKISKVTSVLLLPFTGIKKLLAFFGIEIKVKRRRKVDDVAYIRKITTGMLERVPCYVLVNENVGLRLMSLRFPAQSDEPSENIVPNVMLQLDADQAIVFQPVDAGSFDGDMGDFPDGVGFDD